MEQPGVENKEPSMDFSALTSVVTGADMKSFNQTTTSGRMKRYIATHAPLLNIILIVVVVLVSLLLIKAFSGEPGASTTYVMTMAFLGLFTWLLHRSFRSKLIRQIRLSRFATDNSLTYRFDQPAPTYSGMIFDEGHTRSLEEALILRDGSEVGNYTYVTGSGKNRTTHNYGYIKLRLNRKLPHMVLDAKHNNFLAFSNLPDTFNRSQAMSLEGDFDSHYTLYAPQEYKRDALYVFTPDVMAALIDSGAKYDMEVIDDSLFIYHVVHFDLTSQTQLEGVLSIIRTIGDELKDQTEYYRDERVQDRAQNIIAPEGARLKKGINYLILIVVLLFFVNFGLGAVWPEYMLIANVVIGFVFWGFVIYAIIRSVKRR